MQSAIRAVFVGEGSLLAKCADRFRASGHQVVAVVAHDARLQERAKELGAPVIAPGKGLAQRLDGIAFDYLFSVANLSIISDDVLALPKVMAVNFHDGPLPRYAGLHATNWALLHGETAHGITWHEMLSKVDAGRILVRREVAIGETDTAFSLNARCWEAGLDGFGELVDAITNGTLQPRAQETEGHSYFGKFKRPDAACAFDPMAPAAKWSGLFRALQFGPAPNPLGLPRLRTPAGPIVPGELTVRDGEPSSQQPAGHVTFVCPHGLELRVMTAEGEVSLKGNTTLEGKTVDTRALGLEVGSKLPQLSAEETAQLTALHERTARGEASWAEQLSSLSGVELPLPRKAEKSTGARETLSIDGVTQEGVLPAFVTLLARLSGQETLDLTVSDAQVRAAVGAFETDFACELPVRFKVAASQTVAEAVSSVAASLQTARTRGGIARDIAQRTPALASLRQAGSLPRLSVSVELRGDSQASVSEAPAGSELSLVVSATGAALSYDPSVYAAETIADLSRRIALVNAQLSTRAEAKVSELSLLTNDERETMLERWNDTSVELRGAKTVAEAFSMQVAKTPFAVALRGGGQALTYAEVDARAMKLARRLVARGVGPDVRVGVCVERGIELVIAVLGIHKAGGAYVPLDPAYPAERVAYMVSDAKMPVIVSQTRLQSRLPESDAALVFVDDLAQTNIASEAEVHAAAAKVTPSHLAYVLYTSGSTGRPKGVMVTHENVLNFFAGMDPRVGAEPAGVWLAVTSLSFDISVLELLWTLARGFSVVVAPGQDAASRARTPSSKKRVGFSLFYFASDEGEAASASDKYRLLMEGARFADRNGFEAVWTPERHFHAFGGLYPNPAVASAAIAAITENVKIRAGSVVLPLHSPIRVAEEWALVDNLSKGRVGISVAAGWQPNDFAIMPGNYADRKERMFRETETLKALWRGESRPFPGPNGKDVMVRTLPRPVQKELPIWVTAAGNPETFAQAGAAGANLLTHLLGQSVEELTQKVLVYRKAWKDAGHAGEGHVTLMLHTYVGNDETEVKEIVREPMKGYLRSAMDLVKKAAWHFPTIAQKATASGKTAAQILDEKEITREEMDALLDFSFERYYRTSGLFGTPESCVEMVDAVKEAGVDELGCLIDFGIPSAIALEALPNLAKVKELSEPPAEDESLGALMKKYGVTHLQCTPSLAGMMLADGEAREGLRALKAMMVGGEAFPPPLARELRNTVGGKVINMYGPTETTVWSSTHDVEGDEAPVPLGKPIANTRLYVVDRALQPLPAGIPGELCIGGLGVARGYLHREELTAEKFVADPHSSQSGARMYRTGDLARWKADGTLEFLGRIDHQVKVRGHRIELGEIEASAREVAGVKEAVVSAREDTPGDVRLVAYLTAQSGAEIDPNAVREHIAARLPEAYVPAHVVVLSAFPLTPNGKVDRKALPAPEAQGAAGGAAGADAVMPANEMEEAVAKVWREVLVLDRVGTRDNFFEIGGHSLLVVQVQRLLKDAVGKDLPLTDLFRFPTIEQLARHIGGGGEAAAAALQQEANARADARRDAMRRRVRRP